MRINRHKIDAFVRFMLRRFLDEGCLQSAGALAFTTLFALVPLVAAVFGILAAFPVFAAWREDISGFVFRNFVPATGEAVQGYLTQFAANASKATAVGILVLLASGVALMLSIEDAFNRIWRVPQGRATTSRVVRYWAVITLGPILVVAALGIGSYLFALPFFEEVESEFSLKARLLGLLPFLIEWLTLVCAYALIPNRSVRWRHAAIGALVAAALFEIAKRTFAFYAIQSANYEQVYGALSIIPIFVFWIYLSWVLVLLGASLAATLAAFDYRPGELRMTPGNEFRGVLRVLGHFVVAQRAGFALHTRDLCLREPFLTDDLIQEYLRQLGNAGLIRRGEDGAWALTRDLAATTLYDLYAHSDYRLPTGAPLPGSDGDAADSVASRRLDEVVASLHERMNVPLSEIFPPLPRSDRTAESQPPVSKDSS
jgi:membrane protein